MNLGLQGKQAVVTGSTAGIGLAIASVLAEEGVRVLINGRTEARVAAALDAIRQRCKSADVRGIAADLGNSGVSPSSFNRSGSRHPGKQPGNFRA